MRLLISVSVDQEQLDAFGKIATANHSSPAAEMERAQIEYLGEEFTAHAEEIQRTVAARLRELIAGIEVGFKPGTRTPRPVVVSDTRVHTSIAMDLIHQDQFKFLSIARDTSVNTLKREAYTRYIKAQMLDNPKKFAARLAQARRANTATVNKLLDEPYQSTHVVGTRPRGEPDEISLS